MLPLCHRGPPIQFDTCQTYISKLQDKIYKKYGKRVTWVGIYGPQTQVKYLFKALIFGICKKNILIYSWIRFQLYQSDSLTAIELKVAENPKTGCLWAFW